MIRCGVPPRIISFLKDSDFEAQSCGFSPHLLNHSVYLWGNPGSGKSVMAVKLMISTMVKLAWLPTTQEEIRETLTSETLPYFAQQFRFEPVPHLLQSLRMGLRNEDPEIPERVEMLKRVKYLILDDIGVECGTAWVYETLYQLVDARYARILPTVFTSNLSLNELGRRLGDERLVSRIREMCGDLGIIHLKGPDLRIQPTAESAEF
jgi:DNA replication protein DnaC